MTDRRLSQDTIDEIQGLADVAEDCAEDAGKIGDAEDAAVWQALAVELRRVQEEGTLLSLAGNLLALDELEYRGEMLAGEMGNYLTVNDQAVVLETRRVTKAIAADLAACGRYEMKNAVRRELAEASRWYREYGQTAPWAVKRI